MIWVCRPGKNACYLQFFLDENKIFIPWEGYAIDLSTYKERTKFKDLVVRERNPNNSTTIANWGGMLYSFCNEMHIGDYVLIPHKQSKEYTLAEIIGDYQYGSKSKLHHYRKIKILETNIPREIFPKDIWYSLGAFRSLFHTKHSEQIEIIINQWKDKQKLIELKKGKIDARA